jgi:hypothetical protein
MSWWFDLGVIAIFALLLAAVPWKRPHPNHRFALQMLQLLTDEDDESQSESRGVSGLGDTVSSDNEKHGDVPV